MHHRLAFALPLSVIAAVPAGAIVPALPLPTIAGQQVHWDEMGGSATVIVPQTNSGLAATMEKIQAAIKESGLDACDIRTPDVLAIMRRVGYHWNWIGTHEDPVVWPAFIDKTMADPDRQPGIHGAAKIIIDSSEYYEQPSAGGMLAFDAHSGKDGIETVSCNFSVNNIVEADVTAKLGDRFSQRREDASTIRWTLAPPDDHSWPEGAKGQFILSKQFVWSAVTTRPGSLSGWPETTRGRSAISVEISFPARGKSP